ADGTSAHSETIKVYDTLGTSHTLTVNFQKTGPNTWSYAVTIPGEDVSGGTAGTPAEVSGSSGTLTFGTNGQLTSPDAASPINLAITGLADGASDIAGRVARVTVDQGGPGQRRGVAGTVFRRHAGGCRAGRHGQHSQPRIADRRGKQHLPGERAHRIARHRSARYRRPRRHPGRLHRILHRRYRAGVHQPDRPATRLPGKFPSHYDGRYAEPGNHQSDSLRNCLTITLPHNNVLEYPGECGRYSPESWSVLRGCGVSWTSDRGACPLLPGARFEVRNILA